MNGRKKDGGGRKESKRERLYRCTGAHNMVSLMVSLKIEKGTERKSEIERERERERE